MGSPDLPFSRFPPGTSADFSVSSVINEALRSHDAHASPPLACASRSQASGLAVGTLILAPWEAMQAA